jgi:hypothetical protein
VYVVKKFWLQGKRAMGQLQKRRKDCEGRKRRGVISEFQEQRELR